MRAPGTRPIPSAQAENEISSSKLCVSVGRATTGRRPRPPVIRPSARSAARACRTVPRETEKAADRSASEAIAESGASSPDLICERSFAAIMACRELCSLPFGIALILFAQNSIGSASRTGVAGGGGSLRLVYRWPERQLHPEYVLPAAGL